MAWYYKLIGLLSVFCVPFGVIYEHYILIPVGSIIFGIAFFLDFYDFKNSYGYFPTESPSHHRFSYVKFNEYEKHLWEKYE
jgi:hypothetical protein